MESEPSCKTGRKQPCWGRLCLGPTHSNSVLSVLSFSRFADIQWPTSTMHRSSCSALTQCRHDDREDTVVCRRRIHVNIQRATPLYCRPMAERSKRQRHSFEKNAKNVYCLALWFCLRHKCFSYLNKCYFGVQI